MKNEKVKLKNEEKKLIPEKFLKKRRIKKRRKYIKI